MAHLTLESRLMSHLMTLNRYLDTNIRSDRYTIFFRELKYAKH